MSDNREQRKAKVLEVLNQGRAMELQAVTQYMIQHYGLDAMDLGELAAAIKLIAIDEMRHAEGFAERIKELDGEPTTERADKVITGQDVSQIFNFNFALEDDTVEKYNNFYKICVENGDTLSAKLIEQFIEEEQVHQRNQRRHVHT